MDTYHKRKFKFGILGDPDQMYDFYFTWLLSKLHEIFVWENLPDGVDETFLNNCLFNATYALFFIIMPLSVIYIQDIFLNLLKKMYNNRCFYTF